MGTNCCCNKKIPKSTSHMFILKPNSCKYINGIASSYEIKYFDELEPYIKANEFLKPLDSLISTLQMMWACPMCFCFGYGCSVCTLGLSFLGPYVCIYQAINEFEKEIEKVNRMDYNPRGINLSLKRKCCTSWLQVDIMGGNGGVREGDGKEGNGNNVNNNGEKKVMLFKNQPMADEGN